MAGESEILPEGWERVQEEEYGTHFYYHEPTERSVRTLEEVMRDVPVGWEIYMDDDGDRYFYNDVTSVTVWTLEEAAELSAAAERVGGLSPEETVVEDIEEKGLSKDDEVEAIEDERVDVNNREEINETVDNRVATNGNMSGSGGSSNTSNTLSGLRSRSSSAARLLTKKIGGKGSTRRRRLRRLSQHRQAGVKVPSLAEFNSKPLEILVVSWNVGNKPPEVEELKALLRPQGLGKQPDIIVVGSQECKYHLHGKAGVQSLGGEKLERLEKSWKSRQKRANTTETDDISQNAAHENNDLPGITSHSHWVNLVASVAGSRYQIVSKERLLEMRLVILANSSTAAKLNGMSHTHKATGIAHVYGNKGGLVSALRFGATTLGFVSCHLAAHSKHLLRRNRDCSDILKAARVGNHRLDLLAQCHHVFWLGDLNYRIDLTDTPDGNAESSIAHDVHVKRVRKMIQEEDWEGLYAHDQLHRNIRNGSTLMNMKERMPNFPPTFKVERGSPVATQYQEKRVPSWCDRILWASLSNRIGQHLVCSSFESVPAVTTSDHKPVRARFQVKLEEEIPLIPEEDYETCGVMLKISDLSCCYLPAYDKHTKSSDPYIVFDLVPNDIHNRSKHFKTPVIRRNLNPEWPGAEINILTHVRSVKSLRACFLVASVFDHDRFSADDHIGRTVLDLGELLCSGNGTEKATFDRYLSLNGVQVRGVREPSKIRGCVRVVDPTSHAYKIHFESSRSVKRVADPAAIRGSPQQPHRNTCYPEWDEMTGNFPRPSQGTSTNHPLRSKSKIGFATMASMVVNASSLHNRVTSGVAASANSSRGNNAAFEAHSSSNILPTTLQQLRLTKQRFASPSSESEQGSLTGIVGLSSKTPALGESLHLGIDVVQSSPSVNSLTPVMPRAKTFVDGRLSEPKSRHSQFRPMDRKVCGWLQKKNSKRFFGRTVWRNRWFVLDQRLRVLDYFKDHRPEAFVDGSSPPGPEHLGFESDQPCRAHIDMTKHTIHDNGTLEWELHPVEQDEDGNDELRNGDTVRPGVAKSKKYGRVWVFRADDQDHKRMWIASMKLCSRDGIDDWLARSQGSPKKKRLRE